MYVIALLMCVIRALNSYNSVSMDTNNEENEPHYQTSENFRRRKGSKFRINTSNAETTCMFRKVM